MSHGLRPFMCFENMLLSRCAEIVVLNHHVIEFLYLNGLDLCGANCFSYHNYFSYPIQPSESLRGCGGGTSSRFFFGKTVCANVRPSASPRSGDLPLRPRRFSRAFITSFDSSLMR